LEYSVNMNSKAFLAPSQNELISNLLSTFKISLIAEFIFLLE